MENRPSVFLSSGLGVVSCNRPRYRSYSNCFLSASTDIAAQNASQFYGERLRSPTVKGGTPARKGRTSFQQPDYQQPGYQQPDEPTKNIQ